MGSGFGEVLGHRGISGAGSDGGHGGNIVTIGTHALTYGCDVWSKQDYITD